jgi:hypothetical protein
VRYGGSEEWYTVSSSPIEADIGDHRTSHKARWCAPRPLAPWRAATNCPATCRGGSVTYRTPLDSILRVAEADERYTRAVKRQERFSSEADSETVFLFAQDVKEARSEFLQALEAVFRG